MDVFFSADDKQEYLDLLSQSASKHALDFLAWCLMSNHAHFVVVPVPRDRSRARPEQRIVDTRG
jgi:putative transposase